MSVITNLKEKKRKEKQYSKLKIKEILNYDLAILPSHDSLYLRNLILAH